METLVNATLINSLKRPTIRLKFRNNDKVKYSTIRGIYPYFYIKSDEKIAFPYEKRERGYISYLGEELDKLSFRTIEDLKTGKRNVDFSMESDVFYLTRFLIDSNLTYSPNRRIIYFDIEVERGSGSLDTINTPQPIIVIDAYDNFTQKHYPFVLKDYAEDGVNAYVFDREKELLDSFFNFLNERDFDLSIGWNTKSYDFPYLLNRSKRRNVFESYHEQVFFKNTQPLDLMIAYREFGETGGRYFLDHVASLVLGKRKTKHFEPLSHCIEDVTLTKEIDETLKLSQLIFTFQNLVPLNTIDIMSRSSIIETFLLKRYHNKYVLPNRSHAKHTKYKGAIVREPIEGLYENVSVLDLVSLYPSIVMRYNISPDRELRNPGILTESIREIFHKRMIYKNEYKKKKDIQSKLWNTSYKYLLNSLYGILGFSHSRFYNRELAAEVTQHERTLLQYIWKYVEEKGITILAGDTDSLFIAYPEPEKLVDDINDMLHKQWGEEFNIDLDKQFKRLFLYNKKKNYFGITDDNKLKITGTVVNKTSCPIYLREKLMEGFKLILEGKSVKELKRNVYTEIKEQEPMDIAEWIRLSSIDPKVNTAHLKAAKQRLRLYRIAYTQGEKLPLLPVKDSRIGYLAIHETITNKLPEIDYDVIYEKWFNNPLLEIENILLQRRL